MGPLNNAQIKALVKALDSGLQADPKYQKAANAERHAAASKPTTTTAAIVAAILDISADAAGSPTHRFTSGKKWKALPQVYVSVAAGAEQMVRGRVVRL
jgi:L-alanine-DL-glutamate epimerase-like enolase superfamily enzyme